MAYMHWIPDSTFMTSLIQTLYRGPRNYSKVSLYVYYTILVPQCVKVITAIIL